MREIDVAIAGNPNCGKTTLFNALTGSRQRVGNWGGVTVEKKTGTFIEEETKVNIVDLPGVYSLSVNSPSSIDEKIARSYLTKETPDLVVNIVDASNLERNLYMTLQLLESDNPVIVALNMVDVAEKRNIKVFEKILAQKLGCPVFSMSLAQNKGLDELKKAIVSSDKKELMKNRKKISLGQDLDELIVDIKQELKQEIKDVKNPYWFSVQLIEQDAYAQSAVSLEKREEINKKAQEKLKKESLNLDLLVAKRRYDIIDEICNTAILREKIIKKTLSDYVDDVFLNRFLGLPIFFLIMYLMFMFTINFGNAFIDFFDILSGAIFVDGIREICQKLGFPEILTLILADGFGGGVQTVCTFIPPIGSLFLFLSILEDSGYMARAAVVMDRFMKFLGLPGRAFVPLVVGFGCSVPAIMGTRTLDSDRARKLTMMMCPFMSCGAKLPVYVLFAAAFFPINGQNIVFALYLIGILAAIFTGFMLKRSLLKGDSDPMVLELPSYHMPKFSNIFYQTYHKLSGFIFRAGKIIVPVVMVLSVLNSIGTDGTFGNENKPKSVLSSIGKVVTPIFSPMGIKKDNWAATVGIFTGVFAKEVVVGTLDSLYSTQVEQGEEEAFSFVSKTKEAFVSIKDNLIEIKNTILDPIGLGSIDEQASEMKALNNRVFGEMIKMFDGKVGAFSYLLFILLYMPCAAAVAAVFHEAGFKWSLLCASWTTILAYSSAVSFYQLANFSANPIESIVWFASMIILIIVFYYIITFIAKKAKKLSKL